MMDLKEELARNPYKVVFAGNGNEYEIVQNARQDAWKQGFQACWDYLSEQGVGVMVIGRCGCKGHIGDGCFDRSCKCPEHYNGLCNGFKERFIPLKEVE